MTLPLKGLTFLELGDGTATAYAGHLLAMLGADVVVAGLTATPPDGPPDGRGKLLLGPQPPHVLLDLPVAGALDATGTLAAAAYPVVSAPGQDPLSAWAGCGGMWLTGHPQGPPLPAPSDLAGRMAGAAAALELLARLLGGGLRVDGPRLLGERAALTAHTRQGRVSTGGACRLAPTADGWVAVNLPRPEDWALVPAWLGGTPPQGTESGTRSRPDHTGGEHGGWEVVMTGARARTAEELAAGAQLLGLPVAPLRQPRDAAADAQAAARGQGFPFSPFVIDGRPAATGPDRRLATAADVPPSRPTTPSPRAEPVTVVDLSSLWAGPLATDLLRRGGSRVIKVEGARRPDGARAGSPPLFDLLNAGKESVALDFGTEDGVAALGTLLRAADVVVEASRPRALDNLGLGPDPLLGAEREQVWVTITGHGRTGPHRQWAALGDDAAVAGGLVALDPEGGPVFCADAIADPATGLHAALVVTACLLGGGTRHVDIALREVAGSLLPDAPVLPSPRATAHRGERGWLVDAPQGAVPVEPPRARAPEGPGPGLGADTERVLTEIGARR